MTFAIDDAFLPATLTVPPMTDEEFTAFCAEHPDLNFEMSADGELIVMAPTNSDTGACNFEAAGELRNWARKDRRGIGWFWPPAPQFWGRKSTARGSSFGVCLLRFPV